MTQAALRGLVTPKIYTPASADLKERHKTTVGGEEVGSLMNPGIALLLGQG